MSKFVHINFKQNRHENKTIKNHGFSRNCRSIMLFLRGDRRINPGIHLELRAVPETYMMKGEVIWSSSDPSVVTVDEKGVASGVKEGTASVTAAVDGQEARCDITVVSEVTSFSIDPAQADMVVGDILQLKAVTVPDGIDGEVLWSSSDESVAAVSAAGEVSAVSAGNVTVTASFKDLTAECEISVSDPEPAKVGDFFMTTVHGPQICVRIRRA